MAIFKLTNQVLSTAARVIAEADDRREGVCVARHRIDTVVGEGPKVLNRLKNAVIGVLTFIANAINILRNNPAAKGPWRIVMLLVAGVLRGVELILKGLKAAIDFLIDILTSQIAKNLKKAVDAIKEKILDYIRISNKVKEVVGYLIALADFLEQQQDAIEAAYPGLKNTVANTYLKEIDDTLKNSKRCSRTSTPASMRSPPRWTPSRR